MAISVSNAYVETFESNVRHLAQQRNTRLRQFVTTVNKQSEAHNWDRLAASDYRVKSSPRMVSPAGGNGSGAVDSTDGLDWTRRKTLIGTYDTGEVVEQEDIVQMLIDPKSSSVTNLGMNMSRAVDDVIITAATGNALDGDGGNVGFPAGQVIGSASTVMSLDVVLQVDELFGQNDVDPDEAKVMVINPTIKRKLMQLLEVTSSDFQAQKALATGVLPNWMGYTWIVSNRLLNPDAADGDVSCLAFTKKALGLHVARDITAKVGERTDMSFAWQLYCMMSMAAVRVEDEHIVHVHLKNSIS